MQPMIQKRLSSLLVAWKPGHLTLSVKPNAIRQLFLDGFLNLGHPLVSFLSFLFSYFLNDFLWKLMRSLESLFNVLCYREISQGGVFQQSNVARCDCFFATVTWSSILLPFALEYNSACSFLLIFMILLLVCIPTQSNVFSLELVFFIHYVLDWSFMFGFIWNALFSSKFFDIFQVLETLSYV